MENCCSEVVPRAHLAHSYSSPHSPHSLHVPLGTNQDIINTSTLLDLLLQRAVPCLGTQPGAVVATPSSIQLSFEQPTTVFVFSTKALAPILIVSLTLTPNLAVARWVVTCIPWLKNTVRIIIDTSTYVLRRRVQH